jgi:hypothetical protein
VIDLAATIINNSTRNTMSQIVDTVTHKVEIRMNINLGETNLIICAKTCVTNLVSASVRTRMQDIACKNLAWEEN